MQPLIVRPRPVILTGSGPRREPMRPVAQRPRGFAEQFDDDTLLFDSIFCGPDSVLVLAPPFFNLLPAIKAMAVTALPSGAACAFRIRSMDRHAQIRIRVPAGTERLSLRTPIGDFEIAPQRDLAGFFAGKRVIFTLSRNNRLEWIEDWIRYHRDIHGANAVLLYDNRSTNYSLDDLLETIAGISGIERAGVVDWPFRYGPQGLDAARFWDSDFCQNGALEHARWTFLARAHSAMNCDIDELVVSERGASAFAAAEQSWQGIVRYHGVWVHGLRGITAPPTDEAPARFWNFDHHLRPSVTRKWGVLTMRGNVCPTKWTIVPRRCPPNAQWTAHRIRGWANSITKDGDFSFRHFREINDHWKYDRSAREDFDPARYAFDPLMRANFESVRWTA